MSEFKPEQVDILHELRRNYLPYWPLVALAALLATLTAFLMLRYKEPEYEAYAKIMFRNSKKAQQKTCWVSS